MINKLEICGLTKRFGEKTLFENLDLTLAEPAVLWAPSGWGKTTLLRILMGLEAPDSGTVQGVGRVGAVFQEDRLCPQLTAVQNVELVLPEGKHNTKRKSRRIFNDLDMMSRRLPCLPGSFPAGRSVVRPCSAPSGPGAIPCCWTNPSPAWTRRP